ncbi:queuosine precursor transporter [Brevibacillus laterosporus]|uniref:queuosine precursor transporter n=1 Tax=Brevibacillus laterosporus TaxID=1465 RepID=UPI0018CFB55A|nr:queuosine precursor transporter [Brevibacillus laterosporus]MBG9798806.1 membrane protein [Brevibacillus laterosporus]MCR8935996.1 queuosine precursor transporter [Brevibacillus laterosporus]MCZ0838635.1 queuosine precursor transporter [Brevibacillus laterosporus]MCZ0843206.1 queuosine precursor transporter [Brevibacillus laterosporus]MED1910558.1 queuosine precursor transporter [Brevibacillus laterosporus]
MFNLWFGIGFVLVNFVLFLVCYRFFGKVGLYAWIGFATVLANIQVVKIVELFGFAMTLGNTMYATIYLCSDLLNEKYGQEQAKKAVWFGFFTLITTTIIMQMALKFVPHPDELAKQDALAMIFGLLPRLAIASLTSYFISQFLDVRIYTFLKKICPERNQLWIRNNGSTLISQLVDTVIFCTIAFLGELPMNIWFHILITTYLIKFVVSAASTPILYIARNFTFTKEG